MGEDLRRAMWESMTAPHPKENEAPFCQEAGADTKWSSGLCQQIREEQELSREAVMIRCV